SFQQQVKFHSHQGFLTLHADLSLNLHKPLAPALNLAHGNLVFQSAGSGALFIGVAECSHPIKLCLTNKVTQFFEFLSALTREAYDERGPKRYIRANLPQLLNRA